MPKSSFAFTALFALLGGWAFAHGSPALALGPSRPARACAPLANDLSAPGLWLGHFTGGRLVRVAEGDRVLDWRDDYSCFTTRAACTAWQRSQLRVYRSVEGYRTCLPLRGGGVPIRSATSIVTAKY